MEEEVRQILRNAVKDESQPAARLGSRISARFAQLALITELPELCGQAAQPLAMTAPPRARARK